MSYSWSGRPEYVSRYPANELWLRQRSEGEKAVDAFSEYVDAVNRVDIKERSKRMHDRLEKLREVKEVRFRPLAPVQRKTRTVREVPREEVMKDKDLSPIRDFRPRSKR